MNTLKSNNQLTIEGVIPKNTLNNDEAKRELNKIEQNVDREKLLYETNGYTYSFKNLQTIKTFGRDIYIYMRAKLRLKKQINIKPIYLLKS